MAKEREEVTVSTGTPIRSASEQTTETREQLKARLVSVLERGIVHDRLHVDLPSDVHGEWVRDDPLEVARMQTLGFEIDHEYAKNRSLHSDGSDVGRVADVIFMTCPREVKEIIDEIRHDQFIRANAPSKAKEDQELIANTMRDTEREIAAFTESKSHIVDRDAIAAAVQQADAQTQPAT